MNHCEDLITYSNMIRMLLLPSEKILKVTLILKQEELLRTNITKKKRPYLLLNYQLLSMDMHRIQIISQ